MRIKAHLNGTKLAMYEEYKFCDAVVLRTMDKLRHPTCHECNVMFGDVAILLYPHISIYEIVATPTKPENRKGTASQKTHKHTQRKNRKHKKHNKNQREIST